jgi:hypothetical protein
MKKTPFVWLGANRARRWPVGEKARLLDVAASRGLPVPAGAVLLDEFFQLLLEAGVIVMRKTAVTVTDAEWLAETLYEGVRFPRLDKPVVVRAAFSALDGGETAVHSLPRLAVDLNNPVEVADALAGVWLASPNAGAVFRRDLLVQEMVEGEVGGTAVTGLDAAPDRIAMQDASLELPQLTGFFPRTDVSLPPYARRLQKLLRGVRRVFGKAVWQVDWLDDGRICWVMKVTG